MNLSELNYEHYVNPPAKFWKFTHYQQMPSMKRVGKLPSKAYHSHTSKKDYRSVIKGTRILRGIYLVYLLSKKI